VTPGVQLVGEQTGTALVALQSQALAHVFPSRSEGLAFTTLEAGGYARLAVMSDIPANREVSGGHALFTSLEDSESLIQALIQAASMSATERRYIGNAFASHIKSHYSFPERIDETIRAYREVLQGDGLLTSPVPLAEHFLRP
jgi:glycosyltransferase involved in cell wall biosynthesis